jgi:hypothetical protein
MLKNFLRTPGPSQQLPKIKSSKITKNPSPPSEGGGGEENMADR